MVGNQTRVKVVKNKVAPPFKQIEFDIMYGEGISKAGELIDLGVKAGVVEKSGAWFSYESQRLGQGRENAKQFLKDNPDIADKIEAAIRAERRPDRGEDPRQHRPRRSGDAADARRADEAKLLSRGIPIPSKARPHHRPEGLTHGEPERRKPTRRQCRRPAIGGRARATARPSLAQLPRAASQPAGFVSTRRRPVVT